MNNWINDKDDKKTTVFLDKITSWISAKSISVLSCTTFLLSIVPLIWIGFYNYPSADDYSIGSNAHVAWMNTHNIFLVIGAAMVRAYDDWLNWMGYYTSNFFMALPPSSFGEEMYWMTAVIIIGMLVISTVYLLYMILCKVFGADKKWVLSISSICLFATIQCIPMAGRVEAFYWYAGAANYILLHSLANLFYGLLIECIICNKKRVIKIIITSMLAFLVAGGNQMTALNVAAVLLLVVALVTYKKKWNKAKRILAPIVIYYIGFVLNVAAPGNSVRASAVKGMGPVKAVLISFHRYLENCIGEWTTWTVVLLFVIVAIISWYMTAHISFDFKYPAVVVAMGYCLTSAMFTPPYFAVGNADAGRLQALVYMMYILTTTLSIIYVVGWVRKKFVINSEVTGDITYSGRLAILACIIMFVWGSSLCIIGETNYYSYSSAITELVDGSAMAYYEAQHDRSLLYRENSGVVEVAPLSSQPSMLFFSDITTDVNDWQNRGLARYYQIEGVVVKQ